MNPGAENAAIRIGASPMVRCELPETPVEFWESFPNTKQTRNQFSTINFKVVIYSESVHRSIKIATCEEDLRTVNFRMAGCHFAPIRYKLHNRLRNIDILSFFKLKEKVVTEV